MIVSNENEGIKNSNPKSYTASSEDIVVKNDTIENHERFTRFLNNVENKTDDRIKIIRYTTEGVPIFQQMEYDGEMIQTIHDSSQDEYGSGKIEKTVCSNIEMVEDNEYTFYILKGCENNKGYELLNINQN